MTKFTQAICEYMAAISLVAFALSFALLFPLWVMYGLDLHYSAEDVLVYIKHDVVVIVGSATSATAFAILAAIFAEFSS